jgi:hypothetical protein
MTFALTWGNAASKVNKHVTRILLKATEYNLYCDQPFVSETTGCVSNDLIENNNKSGQNVCAFMCEG